MSANFDWTDPEAKDESFIKKNQHGKWLSYTSTPLGEISNGNICLPSH